MNGLLAYTVMRIAFMIFFALLPCLARAQSTIREEVTVTAHAEDVPFQTLARAVVVLSRAEIARLPGRSIVDVLAYASSVDVRARGPWGVQADFSLRGATFGQALILVDGVRLNDTQSGHHNGDIPVPIDAIERIEVLLGPGSSLYGADAFGGTVNVITRRDASYRTAAISVGSDGYVSGQASIAGTLGAVRHALAVTAERSAGFEVDRDYRIFALSSSTTLARGLRMRSALLLKDFGANGFYGPAQSTEQTNQTLFSLDGRLRASGAWDGQWQAGYRTHGDQFLYDSVRGGTPNEHRTHAIQATGRASRALSSTSRITIGGDTGVDWIHSNNLGDHQLARGSGYVEVQQSVGAHTVLYPAVRVDAYSTFGRSWSPALAAASWLGSRTKLRASAGWAFRVPTFTERFYSDPNNVGTPTLTPERAWASEAGVDRLAPAQVTLGLTVFDRHDRDTIDFVRESPQVRWRAANIRKVHTVGMELTARRPLPGGGVASAGYTWLGATTDPLPLLSKYVLDAARHALALTASGSWTGLDVGQRVRYTLRRDGRRYLVADTRLAHKVGRATLFVEASNLLDTRYQEIIGVNMPGRSFRVGVLAGR